MNTSLSVVSTVAMPPSLLNASLGTSHLTTDFLWSVYRSAWRGGDVDLPELLATAEEKLAFNPGDGCLRMLVSSLRKDVSQEGS